MSDSNWSNQETNLVRRPAGSLRKIAGPKYPCLNEAHEPPKHLVLPPGTYEYTCPTCGYVTIFEVPLIIA